MARIGDFVDVVEPVREDTPGSIIFDRFQTEPNTLAIAVVDDEHRPVGLIERNAFTLKMAAEFGRALYARRPASTLMDPGPPYTEADASAETFFSFIDVAEMNTLLRGFIVIDQGRYVGIGAGVQILQAVAALHRGRAEEMGQLARNLAVAEAEARASSRAKSEFLAVMSHEIRTPLNGVLGIAGLLQRELQQPELRPYVETILDSGQTLLRLLTDALDMSRASAGILTLDPAPLDINALSRDLAGLWGPRAEEKGLDLTIVSGIVDNDWVLADAVRVKQLFNNLIGNALKFTQRGAVTVTLTATADGTGIVRLDGAVEDSGPGVPEAAIATIFDPFNTGEAGREGAGAGLGLAICRQIVDRMSGTIGLSQSSLGGARFHFSLDLPPCEPEHRAPASAAAPTEHETLHVLVVDDNPTNRFVATRLLTMFGCTHETANDGAEAVETAALRPFDLILMDIKMPVMDGVAATRAIRAMSGPAGQTPILALTANADPRDEAEYVAAGMNGVAQKPIQPEALLNSIRLALGTVRMADAA